MFKLFTPFSRANQKTPIFIISFNRKWQLERSIRSYKQLGNVDIIVHDNGSDDPEVVAYLKKLEKDGIDVNWHDKIFKVEDLNNINKSIEKYFKKRPRVDYIVTDPDIELLPGATDTLAVYAFFLKLFPEVISIGPMLKIDDISLGYPLRNHVLNRHIMQFWGHKPEIVKFHKKPVAYLPCTIDTTFSMHRANSPFRRMTKGIRLYGAYAARHLDWYEPGVAGESYSNSSSNDIAHWSNESFHREFSQEKLQYDTYFDVEQEGTNLRIVQRGINEHS